MTIRRLLFLFIIAAVTSLSPTSTQFAARANFASIPQATTIPMLAGSTQPIKLAQGNQTNPHLACNLATFTEDDFQGNSSIRYLDLATNTEHVVPGNGLDRLSDTDGQRIAFTQVEQTGDSIVIYDIASQTTATVPGTRNSDPAIGGNLVAFNHAITLTSSEIGVYFQDSGLATQLTNDGLWNHDPAVDPDGKVVVFEKCQKNGTGCDVYSATPTGPGTFSTRILTGPGEDKQPDTNGQLISYISNKSGENDIYLQRVDGMNEMHLALAGDQRDLPMSGNLLVFESETPTGYDTFLSDLSTAGPYQVTNSPGVNETLSDVVAGCNGLNQIVYATSGPWGDFDVWGVTFQLNESVTDQLNDLIALVQSFNLHDGTEGTLIAKLQDALAAVNASDVVTACVSLTAFISASQAQSGKKLTADQANQLVESARQVKSDLGCQ